MRLEYFEMIDTVEVLDFENQKVRVVSTLPEESPIFDGHFPKFPILPGVLMLEMMNHAAGYLLYRKYEKKRFVFLGGVRRAKFRRFVKPGSVMTVDGTVTHDGSGYHMAETSIVVNGDVAADAEIVMIVSDFPNDVLEDEMQRRSMDIKVLAPAGS